jgi:hypothetical protein
MLDVVNSLVSQAVTDQQIREFLAADPTPQQLASAMQTYGVSPEQVFNAAGVGQGQTLNVGGTIYQPEYQTTGSGQDQQVGPLQNIYSYQADQNKVGGAYNQYDPTGQLQRTGTQQKVDTSLGGAIKDIVSNPGFKLAALAYGGNALADALGGAGIVGSDLAGLSGIPAGSGALTAAEQAALYGTGGGVMGALGGTPAIGGGLTAAGANGLTGAMSTLGGDAALGAGLGAGASTIGSGLGSTLSSLGTGAGLGLGTGLGAGLGTTLGGLTTGVGTGLGTALGTGLATGAGTALGTSLGTGLGLSALGTLAGTAANQSGISDARNLINQYGGIANNQLNAAYQNAQNLNLGNRTDLGNVYQNLNTNLNNTLNAQAGLYGQTNTNLANNYANTLGNMQNLYSQQVGYQNPYQDIGRAGSQGLLANQDYLTHQFNANDLATNLAPNYAFQLQQGQMANQRAGNMGGGALGGNALQGLQKYTQDYAGGAYQNAFNNYNTQRNNIFNSLAGMAQIGTTSAGQLAGLGNTYGSNMGSLSSTYGGNMLGNAGQLQGAYNQYGGNLTNAANTYGGNLTTNAGQGIGAANAYGLNTANLATGLGSALAGNAVAGGANTANALNTLGNTALLGSMIKAT